MSTQSNSTIFPLEGKVAIVTGASRGIGAGLALELARRGAKVTVFYTSPKSGKLSEDITSKIGSFGNGSTSTTVQADLRQLDASDRNCVSN
ncbi:hypothetical protein G6011_11138 [Alternaria panax]|uniref:Uncharacterized protein n=1 Tax=Alternaria panax TaxID=48097 RepID=A0AAD4IDC0_9PLEO|nr:hypothetical protein G6011_11138 [Alternaria panax]